MDDATDLEDLRIEGRRRDALQQHIGAEERADKGADIRIEWACGLQGDEEEGPLHVFRRDGKGKPKGRRRGRSRAEGRRRGPEDPSQRKAS